MFFYGATFALSIAEPVLGGIFGLASIVPTVAVFVRRLHDTNHSGWWLLLYFVPFGGIILFFFLVSSSEELANDYGPNPKTRLSNGLPNR